MSAVAGQRAESQIVVAGAGVLGSSIALVLAQAGVRVVLADPAPLGENASGVAAGMLAPAFEAILDPPMAAHFAMLRDARDLWPDFAAQLGNAKVGLRRAGAIWIDLADSPVGDLDAREAALRAVGANVERLSAEQVRLRIPGVAVRSGGVFTDEDWRLSPQLALAALQAAAREAGARIVGQRLIGYDAGIARLSDGEPVAAEAVILATGARSIDLAPELTSLTPIKGHILRVAGRAEDGAPVVRRAGGYVVPGSDGWRLGATMETGQDDDAIDEAAVSRLLAMGASLYPWLGSATPMAQTGVRATTADGLPLVGPSSRPGVYLAAGARRNGWLLAPLVARVTAAYLAGRDPGPYASLFDARRFGRV